MIIPRHSVQTEQLNTRVSTDLSDWLTTFAATAGTNRADLVRQLLEAFKDGRLAFTRSDAP